jgi:hypothetical protein
VDNEAVLLDHLAEVLDKLAVAFCGFRCKEIVTIHGLLLQ